MRTKADIRVLNGYRLVYAPNHPRAMRSRNWRGYVYEHILVIERRLGRTLAGNENVHHLDGCKSNNRYENLLVLLKSQHAKLHMWLRKGAPGIERPCEKGVNSGNPKEKENHRFCGVCGAPLQGRNKSCSRKCSGVSGKTVKKWTKAVSPLAILSQASGTPEEGAETTGFGYSPK